ncbi:hypothetical protein [Sphingomonas soli]|uniref:hypothetical protein n=1 Tax=Sphingomonas soli TaxID=266127 RepID=UPI000832A642|nr:hypothetical protein [Sphingomonas soli]
MAHKPLAPGIGITTQLTPEGIAAAKAAGFPFAAVSVVDRSRLWLAVSYGFDPREFTRPDSFCDAAIQVPGFAPLCVADAWTEPRFNSLRP